MMVQVAFASLAVVGKVTLEVVPWTSLVLLRTLGALGVFVAWGVIARERMLPPRAEWGRMALLGFLGVFANQAMFLAGLRRSTSINATVLVSTIPLFTALFAALFGRERPSRRFGVGLALAAGGVLLVLRPENASLRREHLLGDLLLLSNSCCYGIYLALARASAVKYGGIAVARWVFLAGAVMALPLGLGDTLATLPTATPRTLFAVGYVVLVTTAFTYAANAWALARVPASVVSVFIYLQPVMVAAMALTAGPGLARWLGVTMAAEVLSARLVFGALLALLGVWVATRK